MIDLESLDGRLEFACGERFSFGYKGDEDKLVSYIDSLLKEGANPFAPISWSRSKSTIIAEYCKHPKILDTFLNHITDPNTPLDTDGNTLAHYIAGVARSHYGCLSETTIDKCLQVFVKHGGDLSRLNNHNENILFTYLSPEVVKMALESGCNPMQKNEDGISPLDLEFKKNLRVTDLTNVYLYVKYGAELSDTQKEMLFGKNVPENIVQGLEALKDKSIRDKNLRALREKVNFRNHYIDPLKRKADVLKDTDKTNKGIEANPVERYRSATHEVKSGKEFMDNYSNESEDVKIMKELFNYQQSKNGER